MSEKQKSDVRFFRFVYDNRNAKIAVIFFKNMRVKMISSIGKKVLLLSCFVSGAIIGSQHYTKDNCVPVPINETTLYGEVHTVFLMNKDKRDPNGLRCWLGNFKRPVKSADWNSQREGILHIGFEDGNKLEIDVNKPLKIQ